VLSCDKGRNGEPCECDPLADDDEPLRESVLVVRHDENTDRRDVRCSHTHPRLHLPLVPPNSIVSKRLSHLFQEMYHLAKNPTFTRVRSFPENANVPCCTCGLLVLLLFYRFCSFSHLGFCSKARPASIAGS